MTLNRGLIYIYIIYKNLYDLKVKYNCQRDINFKNAINSSLEKFKKYFPPRLNNTNIGIVKNRVYL